MVVPLGQHSPRTTARNTSPRPAMGPSTWPETEISSRDESVLLQAARLRPFGVNYLQGAICPSLGLLAHLDGTSVHFFSFPAGASRGEPWGACVASINLSAGTRTSNRDGDGRGASREGDGGVGCSPAGGVPRSLSWTQCDRPVVTASPPVDASVAVSSVPAVATVTPGMLGGGGGGSQGGGGGGKVPARGKVSAHLAVACGAEVRLWGVSRVSSRGGAGEDGQWEENEGADWQYRYSIVEVLTDWHRTIGDCGDKAAAVAAAAAAASRITNEDGNNDEENEAGRDGYATQTKGKGFSTCDAKVRCMSFRPGGGNDARKLEKERKGEEGAPLAVWYDDGAAVLGPGRKRAIFPAPVAKKRACGAWSGCGRYLATSSGGEIRVHIDPSGKDALGAIGDVDVAPAEQPARAVEAWADSDSAATPAVGVLATEASDEGSAPFAQLVSTSGAGESGGDFGGKSFRTVLCVEAALCDGGSGVLSSPGSSPGGSSPSSPRSTPSRRRGPASGRHGLNDLTPPPSFAHMPSSLEKSDSECRFNLSSKSASSKVLMGNVSSKPAATSKVLIGDMRAMCPAGPSAFFGTTDGGLGVASLFGGGGGLGESFTAVTSSGRGQDLLCAVVSDSVARVAAAAGATTDAALSVRDIASPTQTSLGGSGGGEDGDKHSRRGGFRHVLPGENWLAGSLRPRSRSPPTQSLRQGSLFLESFSSAQASRNAAGEAITGAAGAVATLVSAAEAGHTATASALDSGGLLPGAPNPTVACSLPISASTPEVLDLRGKIGGLHSGAGGGAAALGVASTHPLFRLSLDGGNEPGVHNSAGSRTAPNIDGVDVRGADVRNFNGGPNVTGVSESYSNTADTPSRRPWLMRVSCRSTSTAGSRDSKGAGNDGVRVKTLAALPLELASPDLLASSDDGNFVAVGSHASGLVACFRLSVRLVAGRRPASGAAVSRAAAACERDEHENYRSGVAHEREHETSRSGVEGANSVGGTSAGSSVNVAGGSGGRRRRQKRLAVPLCTLRLPSGYRAKGLAFVKDGGEVIGDEDLTRCEDTTGGGELKGREETEGVGTAMRAAVGDSRGSGSPISAADGASRSGGVEVLVLAGCPVVDPNAVVGGVTAKKALPLASRSLGKGAVELSYRTVLLRFPLPRIAVGGNDDMKRSLPVSPKAYADEPRDTNEMKSASSRQNKDEASRIGLGLSDCLSGRGRSAGGSCEARTATDVGVIYREVKGDGGSASGAGGFLQEEFTRLPLSVRGGGDDSSGVVGVDDGGAVASDALNVLEHNTRPACDILNSGGGGAGTGSNAVERQGSARFETTVLEQLWGMEKRLDERLDRIERGMRGLCDRVGDLERSLDDHSLDNTGEKRD